MKERTTFNAFLLLASLAFVTGCASSRQKPQREPARLAGATRANAMSAAEAVLSEMHFTLAKNDFDQGVIQTHPLSGAQCFEFWRTDNATLAEALQANVHTIRRSVELNFGPADKPLKIECTVRVQRLSLPEKDIPSISQAYRLYSQSSRNTQKLKLYPELTRAMAWVDLGDDPVLAEKIRKRILQRITRSEKDGTA